MITLVADVGGTQSRLGLVQNGVLNESSICNFLNNNFNSFYEVVSEYLRDKKEIKIFSCVIAIAGPIVEGKASFTNLDWNISDSEIKILTKCGNVVLINDLTSLGYSLKKLAPKGIQHIIGPEIFNRKNGQYLVVGLGTGFNVCPVVEDKSEKPVCLQVELGHISLPSSVKEVLFKKIGPCKFVTVEDLFSGKGLRDLYKVVSSGKIKSGEMISKEHLEKSDPYATQTLELFSEMLGLMTRELILQYLPFGGIYFAGSVSRAIFNAKLTSKFEEAFKENTHYFKELEKFQINLITDDAAGLLGCGVLSVA
ncbi:glucokinase [Amylibacter sp.]|jgi:glucokinase|nr:glucokinase [Amylibacter sp.]MDA9313835.1 glucokinase [Amylibacter sp.]MDA9329576.1 glucokinase [Amylibacter sp.]MDA9355610.1 glucokinase [Amylibacter sp.]MDB2320933.1 glucokinase [Amylibacter sp.]|tara:strand:- start:946 stop:1875 length:930 start_codon:yes stop_codon:yes gene_type:complete